MPRNYLAWGASIALFISPFAHAGSPQKHSSTEDFMRAFPSVQQIEIDDFIGKIEIVVGGEDTAVIMKKGKKTYPVDFIADGEVLRIAGEQRSKHFRLHKQLNWKKYQENALDVFLADYPVLQLSLPKNAELQLDEVITKTFAGDGLSFLKIEKGYVEGAFGDVIEADININSSGDVSLGQVQKKLSANIYGSGDLSALDVGEAQFSVSGSGGIEVDDINKSAELRINGSGDIETSDIGSSLIADISGSGDISVDNVDGGAKLSIAGSGDMMLGSVNGHTKVHIAGNGDIEIDHGLSEDLYVSIAGSGSLDHGGTSTNLSVSIVGSGSVDVKKNTGSLTTSGQQGVLTVNGERINLRKKKKKYKN